MLTTFGLLSLLEKDLCDRSCFRHSGFGVLMVMLANHAVGLVRSLLDDVRLQTLDKVSMLRFDAQSEPVIPLPLQVLKTRFEMTTEVLLRILARPACDRPRGSNRDRVAHRNGQFSRDPLGTIAKELVTGGGLTSPQSCQSATRAG